MAQKTTEKQINFILPVWLLGTLFLILILLFLGCSHSSCQLRAAEELQAYYNTLSTTTSEYPKVLECVRLKSVPGYICSVQGDEDGNRQTITFRVMPPPDNCKVNGSN